MPSKQTLSTLGGPPPAKATLATLGMANAAPLSDDDIARLIAAAGAMPAPAYMDALERIAQIRRMQMGVKP